MQNGPCGHAHAFMYVCVRAGVRTRDCSSTHARHAHVWPPAHVLYELLISVAATRHVTILEHDKPDLQDESAPSHTHRTRRISQSAVAE